MQIYIYHDGQQCGPYLPKEVKAHCAIGQFSETDLAWCEGLTEWMPLSTVMAHVPPSESKPRATKKAVAHDDPLTDPSAPWRSDPASEAQKIKLSYCGCPIKSGLTKGEASDLIDEVMTKHPEKEDQYRQWKQLQEDTELWYQQAIDSDFCAEGEMGKPTKEMIRDTIAFLNNTSPDWPRKNGGNGFAIILMQRYPQLDQRSRA